jgi:hypothetical protein
VDTAPFAEPVGMEELLQTDSEKSGREKLLQQIKL